MLAYIFWHTSASGSDATEYQRKLGSFHACIARAAIDGFVSSRSFRVRGLTWLPEDHSGYEDWYVLRDSCSLDKLDEAAVTAAKQTHDEVAAASEWGTGGLYRLRRGEPANAGRRAYWFSKPQHMPYSELYAALDALLPPNASLWQRKMTLGPAREFCLECDEDVTLPGDWHVVEAGRESVGVNPA